MVRFSFAEKGMFPEAITAVTRARASNPWYWADLAYIQGRAGHLAEARQALRELQRLSREQQVDQAVFVRAYLGIGDKERAFGSLEKAHANHSVLMTTLKVDPMLDPFRSDPRFQELLRDVGLSQP